MGGGGGGVWLMASPILITFVLGTSNKGQGGLFTSFSIIDYLYTGNQQLNAKLVNIRSKYRTCLPCLPGRAGPAYSGPLEIFAVNRII